MNLAKTFISASAARDLTVRTRRKKIHGLYCCS
jgi:hypothetical protein